MQTNRVHAIAIILATVVVWGCSNSTPRRMDVNSAIPTIVIDTLPVTAGVVFSEQLTSFSATEKQQNGKKWQIGLGNTNRGVLSDIFTSLFETVIEFPNAEAAASSSQPVEFTLVPRIEDYSMLSAADAGGKFWAVSMRHFIDIYDADGARAGSMEVNSYGRQRKGGAMSNGIAEIDAATDDAFRDLAVTLVVELPNQLRMAGLIVDQNDVDTPAENTL